MGLLELDERIMRSNIVLEEIKKRKNIRKEYYDRHLHYIEITARDSIKAVLGGGMDHMPGHHSYHMDPTGTPSSEDDLNITDEERSMMYNIFDMFDKNGDRVWDHEELNEFYFKTRGDFASIEEWAELCDAVGAHPDQGLDIQHVLFLFAHDEVFRRDCQQLFKRPEPGSTFDAGDDEDEALYCEGGYHRVNIGDVIHNKYTVKRKLGWGNFSTVWLAVDHDERPVALKISRGAEEFRYQSEHEETVLRRSNEFYEQCQDDLKHFASRVVRMIDVFDIHGPHGTHRTMALEAVGPDLLKILTAHDFTGIKPAIVKTLTRGILEALAFVHEMELAHADLKPENILLQTLDAKGNEDPEHTQRLLQGKFEVPPGVSLAEHMNDLYQCKVSDFGSSKWVMEDQSVHLMQTLEYRAPEVVFGFSPDVSIDIWSVACIVFELLTGYFLFNPKAYQGPLEQDEYHVQLFIELAGEVPEELAMGGWHCPKYFDDTGTFRFGPVNQTDFVEMVVSHGFSEQQAVELVSFLRPMIELDPRNRITAKEALQHPWLEVREGDQYPATREGRLKAGLPEDFDPYGDAPPPAEPSPYSTASAPTLDSHPSAPPPSSTTVSLPDSLRRALEILELQQRATFADLKKDELKERRAIRSEFFPNHLEALKESARARA